VQRLGLVAAQLDRQPLSECWAHILSTSQDPLNSAKQLVDRRRLTQIAGGAGLEHAFAVLLLRMHAQEENWNLGPYRLNLTEHIDTAAASQRDIENHELPLLTLDMCQRLRSVSCLVANRVLDLTRQEVSEAVTHDRMIVGDKYSNHSFHP